MLKFAHPEYLQALWLLIPMALIFFFYYQKRRKIFARFGNQGLIEQLSQSSSAWRRHTKVALLFVGFIVLVLAWANPLLGTKFEKVERNGVDVIFAIDVSKSMLAEDVVPSRMLKAKQFVSNTINQMSNDRVGLIVFAGNAYLQMPLSIDYAAAKMYLKTVDTDIVPTQGTAIGEAVRLATKSFVLEEDKYKVLVLISDGENHEGEAEKAIQEATEKGIRVYSIGVGTTTGGKIPEGRNGFKTDFEGNIVISQLNEKMLQDLAVEGKGEYHNLEEKDVEEAILSSIGAMEGKSFDESTFTAYKNHFPLLLSIVFSLLLLEFLLGDKKQSFLKKEEA